MGDKNLTKRQRQILDFLNEFKEVHNYAPSFREIGDHFNFSSLGTVHSHIKALEDKGFLTTDFNSARSINLINIKTNWAQSVELALAGLITAGVPIEAVEEKEMIAIPESLVRDPANSYVLRVVGSSMIDDGIFDGDYVIVERNPSPQNGDVVVALLNNAYATLKRFYREANRIRLQPANTAMKPIYVRDPIIQGVVRGIIRQFV
jgi:repressor LexA